MNAIRKTLSYALVASMLTAGAAFAQDHHDDHHDDHQQEHRDNGGYVHHNEWKRGYRMNNNDWSRGQRVDYRTNHLAAPRRGYEWRQVDGNYVMAAVATGLIASVIVASAAH